MHRIAALLPVKCRFKQVYPVAGSWGTVATSIPRKQENNDYGVGRVSNEKTDPVVACSRPPPLPPVIGPLVAFSLFDMWSSHDGDND